MAIGWLKVCRSIQELLLTVLLQIIDIVEPNGRTFIKLPEYRGTCVKVMVNGQQAGVVAWYPNELDISDLLRIGDNDICIEVFSSRRNSHGPLFNSEKWPAWTGPGGYNNFTGKFNLVLCG